LTIINFCLTLEPWPSASHNSTYIFGPSQCSSEWPLSHCLSCHAVVYIQHCSWKSCSYKSSMKLPDIQTVASKNWLHPVWDTRSHRFKTEEPDQRINYKILCVL
jgi:hypothetical protein